MKEGIEGIEGMDGMDGMEDVNKRFNEELGWQVRGVLPVNHIYRLGFPGEILRFAGVPNLPIKLKASILSIKANAPHHPYEMFELKDLPYYINDPLAVFSYGDKTKTINVVTEMIHRDQNFLVGIAIDPALKGKNLEMNNIRSVFPKDTYKWVNWINIGKGLYFNKKKVLNLLDQQQTDTADVAFGLPENRVQQGGSKPKLSMSKSDILSAINIIQNF